MTDLRTLLLNIRDFIFFLVGLIQSIFLIYQLKPDVIFLKGGFVGVPVGISSAIWRIPFITHDSDALAGLANRLVSRWAKYHATAFGPDNYSYPKDKVKQVGVIVGPQYSMVTKSKLSKTKAELGIDKNMSVLMVTGGSGGSAVINNAIAQNVSEQLDHNPNLYIIHQVGLGKGGCYSNLEHPRLEVHELLTDMHRYSACADVIVSRAGANTIAEFGVQAKPCIVVPNPLLTGGHQLLNAKYWLDNNAVIVVEEGKLIDSHGDKLWDEVNNLLKNRAEASQLAKKLNNLVANDASKKIASLLITVSNRGKGDA